MKELMFRRQIFILVAVLVTSFVVPVTQASTAKQLRREAGTALHELYSTTPSAHKLAGSAKGILVFPAIHKGGFLTTAQHGEGALLGAKGGKAAGYYSTKAASFGVQPAGQKFACALFFMTPAGIEYLKKGKDWEIGTGPTVAVVDKIMAASLGTAALDKDVYAFGFNEKGLIQGFSVQGARISKIHLR
jgi:lipid-binding SYLF domain-containing protein